MTAAAVRDAHRSDIGRIAQVARASWMETYRGILDPVAIEERLDRDYRRDVVAARVDQAVARHDSHFLVAERDGVVVGFADYGVGARGPELFAIYADPTAYGTGVVSALLATLHARIAERVDGYVLDVHSRNARGRAFYARNGFVTVGGGATPDCDLTLHRSLLPERKDEEAIGDPRSISTPFGSLEPAGARGEPEVTSERRILVTAMATDHLHRAEPKREPGRRAPAPGRLRALQAFINTNDIEERHDEFSSPDKLGRWLARHRLTARGTPVSEADRRWTIAVREALRDLIDAREARSASGPAAAVLDAAAKTSGLTITFGPDGASWTPSQGGVQAAVGRILAELPLAAASGDWRRLKTCRNDACRWVFYDSSRNRSGRWCSMAICGNRMKARAHRARVRRGRGGRGTPRRHASESA